MEPDQDDLILELLAELRGHKQDYVHQRFMKLFGLLYERAKEGCLCMEKAQIYRQQGAAIAMRDLMDSLQDADDYS